MYFKAAFLMKILRGKFGRIINFRFTTGCFSLRSKCALGKVFLGPKLFLKIKIENFYLQKQLRSDRFSLGTPFFS